MNEESKKYELLTLNASIEIFDIFMRKVSRDLSPEDYKLFLRHFLETTTDVR